MREVWWPAPDFEGLYEGTSLGRDLTRPREVPSSNRWGVAGVRRYKGQVLKPTPNEKGYLSLRLCRGGSTKKVRVYVHRLVARAFLPNPQGLPQVLHWDDDPTNNQVINLRWGNQSMNEWDKVRNKVG